MRPPAVPAVPVLDAAAVVSIRCMVVPLLPRGRVSERAMGRGPMRQTREAHPFVLRAETARLSRDAIEALAGEIPRDEAQVAGQLEECIRGYFARAFTTTALAALHAGVPVEARHLV